jgi:F-type H+-transporting ATPase subunit b
MEALGINIPGLIVQLINFTLLLVLLRVVLYKPVLRMLDERRQRIAQSMETADTLKEQAVETERQVEAQLEQARREGQALVAQSQQIAARIQEEARTAAQTQAEGLLARARTEIQLERDTAIASLRQEFADLTIATAERVINQSLDKKAHQRLIDEALAESTFRGN